MDYKTNILANELEITETLLPEIAGLHFGILGEDKAVFDYTQYFEENNLQPIDYKIFMRANKHFIEILTKQTNKNTTEVFYQNPNGHILVAAELVFLFLAFANPDMCLYFNGLISDVISDGVAYSNGFIFSMAAQRLPTDVLHDIIKERQNDTDKTE